MRSEPSRTPAPRHPGALAAAALVAAVLAAACGGAPAVEDPDAIGPRWSLSLDESGHLRLDGPAHDRRDRFVRLVPQRWPASEPQPLLGIGALAEDGGDDVELWTSTWSVDLDAIGAEITDELGQLGSTKHACTIVGVDGRFATLDCGVEVGVTAGDLYFVVNAQPDASDRRFGARVGALLRVTEVADTTCIARIEHSRAPVRERDPAVFAQASFDLPTRNATVLVAPFDRDAGHTSAFPAVADAMPEYLAAFGLTNVGVEAFPRFLDPRPFDAARAAADAATGEYGCIVFGQIDGDTLVFNATAYGASPHPATTVGILPGGLPLPIGDSVESLSRQLAPSFLATVLALRGDHALAAYFVETVLATERLEPAVRFHLREHLALRYESLGFVTEALRLMAADIAHARRDDDVYALLNALSIRSHLDDVSGLADQWLADASEFLAVAGPVLPAESLGREKLELARATSANGDLDAAREIIGEVVRDAAERGDQDLERWARTELAFTMLDDPAVARLALADVDPLLADADPDDVAIVRLLEAELAAAMDDADAARRALAQALERVADSETTTLKASVYRRAANVFARLERHADAVASLQEAARLYLDSAQLDRAASALVDLSYLELQLVQASGPDGALQAIQQARQNIILGAELALRLGALNEATSAFVWAALIEDELGQRDASEFLLDRAERFALASGDPVAVYELYDHRSRLAERARDLEAAAHFQGRALLFARAAGIEVDGASIEAEYE